MSLHRWWSRSSANREEKNVLLQHRSRSVSRSIEACSRARITGNYAYGVCKHVRQGVWQKVVKSVSYASETWCVGLLYAKKGITMKHCRVGVVQSAQRAAAVSSGRHADGQCSRIVKKGYQTFFSSRGRREHFSPYITLTLTLSSVPSAKGFGTKGW